MQPNIDLLAQQLSQQAAKMRASMDDEELAALDEPEQQAPEQLLAPDIGQLGPQGPQAQQRLLEAVGDGGILPSDIQLVQELGRLSVQKVAAAGLEGAEQYAAVVVYAARYVSGLPYQPPVNVLIKEFLPIAHRVACNDLLVLKQLCGLPNNKWQVATAERCTNPPVVQLLGYFSAPPSEQASDMSGSDADKESLWIVYKWEGMKPLALYMQSGPPAPPSGILQGLFMSREAAAAVALSQRQAMLRAIAKGILSAVAFCHERGVVHGSLSPGSILLSSVEDSSADELIVKLDGFGFGTMYSVAVPGSSGAGPSSGKPSSKVQATAAGGFTGARPDAAERRQHDIRAVGLNLAELFMMGLAPADESGRPSAMMSNPALQRMLFGVFHESVDEFRDYCLQDASYHAFVDFMDANSRSGWQLLGTLLEGEQAASDLLLSAFFSAPDS